MAPANLIPSTPAVSTNIDGSITGEASQNAITADSGTPMAKSAAMSGITPQEQKGESPPASAASPIITAGAPVKARAIRLSAPVAPAQAATRIDRNRKGAVCRSDCAVNATLSRACAGSRIASKARIRAEASQTRWPRHRDLTKATGPVTAGLVSVISKSPEL